MGTGFAPVEARDTPEVIESEEREEEPGLEPGRDRAIRLFEYLRRLAELRTPTVRDVAAYPEVVWFGEIPAEPECRVITRVPPAGPLQWLTIDRPRRSPPPELPVELLAWADARELADSSSQPELHAIVEEVEAEAAGFETELEPVRVVDRPETHPEVVEAWADYLPRWQRWAAEDRRLRPIFEVYKRLFDVEQLGNQLGEQYETVVGIGLLTWSGPTGAIRRHLLTVPADLRFDAETGRISLEQPADGARPPPEEDMVQGGRLPSRDVKRSLDERLLEAEPWDRATIDGVLRAWVHSADTRGSYEPAVAPPERAGDAPPVHFAPAVILRRRSPRSLIEFYSSVVEQLRDEATTVPPAVHDIIEILEEQAAGDGTLAGLEPPAVEPPAAEEDPAPPAGPADREVYFPLPSNDEQWRIVERLERHRGVVVQGPPGTGKSHTIANLISHLAAVGKRVLVTSHTGRALEVLKAKLPPDVAKLCVSVVGDGRRGTGDLERSIQALVARTADPDWTDDAIDERVAELRQRLRDVGEERH